MTICAYCREKLTTDTALLSRTGREVEVEYCEKCGVLWTFSVDGLAWWKDGGE